MSLSPADYASTVKRVSELGFSGGIIYDALILKVAEKSNASRVLTLNMRHFTRLWEGEDGILYEP